MSATRLVRVFLDAVERELGPLDVLINNAGIMPVGKLVDEPDAVTRRILDINTYGVIVGTKLATQRMIPRADRPRHQRRVAGRRNLHARSRDVLRQ